MSYPAQMLATLAQAIKKDFASFDADSGRFRKKPSNPPAPGARPEDIGWCVINQDIIYPLALLYKTPDNEFYRDPAILEMALRGGDAIRNFQQPDGKVEFLTTDGGRWGFIYMPWTNYAWLETYQLLLEELGPERQQQWATGLTLAHDSQAKEISTLPLHNIPAWKGMSCWRAGQIFQRPDWQAAGQAECRAVAAAQYRDGYWPEHGGPSTLYNGVYVHALGLYYLFSGDENVLPALERAAEFHQHFCYPDGTLVETIDGRCKYNQNLYLIGWPGLYCSAKGRRLAALLAGQLQAERDFSSYQGGAIASNIVHWSTAASAPILLDQEAFQVRFADQAAVFRQGPWFACLSAFLSPPVHNRWGQDRQSFFSLWREGHGLLFGGGNSKDQPEYSNFIAAGRYLPERLELLPDASGLNLYYGPVCCTLSCQVSADKVTLRSSASNGTALQQFVIRLKAGQRIRRSSGEEIELSLERPICWQAPELGQELEFPGGRLRLPPGTAFRWPIFPFNPYATDGAATFGSEAGLLQARLLQARLGSTELCWEILP